MSGLLLGLFEREVELNLAPILEALVHGSITRIITAVLQKFG